MKKLLCFLRSHRKYKPVVIIDDISRLARDVDAHLKLRLAIMKAGGRLESPSIEFGEDSDSILVEHLLASVSQHHRQKNAEQVRNRVRARIMNGYWTYPAPPGYRYKATKGQGKILVRDEPLASIVQEALEGFASGRFGTQSEVKRFLENSGVYPRNREGIVRVQRVYEMLTRIIYSGYIDLPDKGITMVEGRHPPLIDFSTFKRIQDRLNSKAKVCARKNDDEAFPLRGFVKCGSCGGPLTGGFSTGRSKRYAYYFCFSRSCTEYRKSIKRSDMHTRFEEVIKRLKPSRTLLTIASEMFNDIWNSRQSQNKKRLDTIRKEHAKIDHQVTQLLDRIVDAENDSVISAYEKRIQTLDVRKVELKELAEEIEKPKAGFERTFRTAMSFLSNPYKLWASEELNHRRTLLKLAFLNNPEYDRDSGFRTADFSIPFKVLEGINNNSCHMVPPHGLEPRTY
ncbi:recombinase zinc beta ribbon domain-containing protein [Parvularcula sp. IMCC14364]|uniref:recombinase zinc beta ribbon domain-containing protein n=1 Tax=Parvularcula sp. IMCC14364 TaxID=3067902 RepID=UPI0035582F52